MKITREIENRDGTSRLHMVGHCCCCCCVSKCDKLMGSGWTDSDGRTGQYMKLVSRWTTIETKRLIRAGVIMCNLFVVPRDGLTTAYRPTVWLRRILSSSVSKPDDVGLNCSEDHFPTLRNKYNYTICRNTKHE